MATETVVTMDTSSIKFGPGATREIGFDMQAQGATRVMVVTDPRLSDSAAVRTVMAALEAEGIDAVLFDRARVEPTDRSFLEAIAFAKDGRFDGYVGVGGGSSMDTAKVANLYATYPADLLTYVNPPIGQGKPPPGKLRPLIAVPTTAGTGSETTGVAIFDYTVMHAKTGIAHRALRPVMGIIDPDNTRSLPPTVAACSALDVLSHAIESLTAVPYGQRAAPDNPGQRPAYQGANMISDVWAARAIEIAARYLVRAISDASDDEARGQMLLAAAFAGIGFGNAGCHVPHAMSYPVSGMVRDYRAPDYPVDRALIPHGMSVILNAPALFRFTAAAGPERHLYAAQLLGTDIRGAAPEDAGRVLSGALIALMKQIGMPNGLEAVGFTPADADALVEGTMAQQRLTKLSPRPVTAGDLKAIFLDAMRYW
ncbi:MAG: iron-containing alcohol dehydrogenase [Chloroflexi bacterium]|nr:iron-containing alcohol dehydrogenase [Chloroflexota bacterium]